MTQARSLNWSLIKHKKATLAAMTTGERSAFDAFVGHWKETGKFSGSSPREGYWDKAGRKVGGNKLFHARFGGTNRLWGYINGGQMVILQLNEHDYKAHAGDYDDYQVYDEYYDNAGGYDIYGEIQNQRSQKIQQQMHYINDPSYNAYNAGSSLNNYDYGVTLQVGAIVIAITLLTFIACCVGFCSGAIVSALYKKYTSKAELQANKAHDYSRVEV
eukprot:104689_1